MGSSPLRRALRGRLQAICGDGREGQVWDLMVMHCCGQPDSMLNYEMKIKDEPHSYRLNIELYSVCRVLWRRRTTLEADMH